MTTQVYFIAPEWLVDPIKIGCSKMSMERVMVLAQQSPMPLRLVAAAPGDFRLERCLHDMFAADRSHGEWFRASPALLEGIERVRAGEPIVEAFGIPTRVKRSRWHGDNVVYLRPQAEAAA